MSNRAQRRGAARKGRGVSNSKLAGVPLKYNTRTGEVVEDDPPEAPEPEEVKPAVRDDRRGQPGLVLSALDVALDGSADLPARLTAVRQARRVLDRIELNVLTNATYRPEFSASFIARSAGLSRPGVVKRMSSLRRAAPRGALIRGGSGGSPDTAPQ